MQNSQDWHHRALSLPPEAASLNTSPLLHCEWESPAYAGHLFCFWAFSFGCRDAGWASGSGVPRQPAHPHTPPSTQPPTSQHSAAPCLGSYVATCLSWALSLPLHRNKHVRPLFQTLKTGTEMLCLLSINDVCRADTQPSTTARHEVAKSKTVGSAGVEFAGYGVWFGEAGMSPPPCRSRTDSPLPEQS